MSLYKKRLKLVRGKGVYVWDENGNKYLDAIAGIGVAILGHSNEELAIAINEQMKKLVVAGPMFHHEEKDEALEELSKFLSFEYAYFGNSGTEAVEAALKFARLYTGKKEIIAMTKAFHGRTFGSLSATWKKKYRGGFEPLVPGFKHIPFNNIEVAKEAITKETAAVIVEPIQGEGGINVIDKDYLEKVNKLCKEKDILLIFDEVQTGFGRTGEFFAYQHFGIEPDIMTLAKTLGGGFPIGAMVAKKEVADLMVPGTHASTFGGSPLACASAIAVIKTIKEKKLLEKVRKNGKYLREKLEKLKKKYDFIKRVKGMGLMLAVELEMDGKEFYKKCLEKKLLLNCTHGNVIRIMPALTVKKKEIDEAVEIMDECFSSLI
ncbi:MAG: acetylornithine/acetyl-lysine aminotransferase [Thermoplasmata archaeon]|nr:MAG: acetylornithine/acetyl-lysine aminotransferase [Thermoplasmata archaeon]